MRKTRETALSSIHEYNIHRQNTIRRRQSNSETEPHQEAESQTPQNTEEDDPETEQEPEPEVIWIRRDEVYPELLNPKPMSFEVEENGCNTQIISKDIYKERDRKPRKLAHERKTNSGRQQSQRPSNRRVKDATSDLYVRKLIVAEWQRIAAVIDRVLFWVYLLGTIASYVVILFVIPKRNYDHWDAEIHHIPPVSSESRFTM